MEIRDLKMEQGSNLCCEICKSRCDGDLRQDDVCELAFWECVGVFRCQLESICDSDKLLFIIAKWNELDSSVRLTLFTHAKVVTEIPEASK